jgi:hypothetical protein
MSLDKLNFYPVRLNLVQMHSELRQVLQTLIQARLCVPAAVPGGTNTDWFVAFVCLVVDIIKKIPCSSYWYILLRDGRDVFLEKASLRDFPFE